eukprot:20299-Pyramimonas_sp.AAC.1
MVGTCSGRRSLRCGRAPGSGRGRQTDSSRQLRSVPSAPRGTGGTYLGSQTLRQTGDRRETPTRASVDKRRVHVRRAHVSPARCQSGTKQVRVCPSVTALATQHPPAKRRGGGILHCWNDLHPPAKRRGGGGIMHCWNALRPPAKRHGGWYSALLECSTPPC